MNAHPEEDIRALEFRLRDSVTRETFYYAPSSWEELESSVLSMVQHRGNPIEIWAAPRYAVDPMMPSDELPVDEWGQVLPPWTQIGQTSSYEFWRLNGSRMGYVEGWVVTHDGETVAGPFDNPNDPFIWLQRHRPQSWDWEIRYSGYDVREVRGGQVVYSYKRDEIQKQQPPSSEMGAIELIELGDHHELEDVYGDDVLDPTLGAKVRKRTPLAKAKKIASKAKRQLKRFAEEIIVVGSIRRGVPEVGDVEFVLLPDGWEIQGALEEFATELEDLGYDVGPSIRKATKIIDGMKVEVYIAHHEKELGGLVFMYTGDQQFNIAMRNKAKKMGYLLNQYGIWTRDKKRALLQSDDERDFFGFLGVPYHTPSERSLKQRFKKTRKKSQTGRKKGGRMGMLDDTEESFFSRLESVWGDIQE